MKQPAPAPAGPVLDDDVVRRLRALRDQVAQPGEDVLGDLLALFVRDSAARIDRIKNAIAAGRPEERRHAAHALKGSASNIGALRASALAGWIEKHDVDAADVDVLAAEVQRAVEELRRRLA